MTVDKFEPDWPCDVIDQQGSRCPTVITSSHWTATESQTMLYSLYMYYVTNLIMKLKYHVKHFIQNLYILETYFTELYDLIIVCICRQCLKFKIVSNRIKGNHVSTKFMSKLYYLWILWCVIWFRSDWLMLISDTVGRCVIL